MAPAVGAGDTGRAKQAEVRARGERRAPRGPSGVASAGAGLASQLPGLWPARACRVQRESQAQEAPSTALARPPANLARCSWPQGDGSVTPFPRHRRWWDPQGGGVRAAGPRGLPPSPHLPPSSRILPGPFCSWAQKGTTPVLSDVLSELTLRVAKLWSRCLSFQKLLGARPLINYRAWMGRVFWEDGGGTWKTFADFSFLLKSSSRGSDPPAKWSPRGSLCFQWADIIR